MPHAHPQGNGDEKSESDSESETKVNFLLVNLYGRGIDDCPNPQP